MVVLRTFSIAIKNAVETNETYWESKLAEFSNKSVNSVIEFIKDQDKTKTDIEMGKPRRSAALRIHL
jgi:hypothetical protein